MAFVESRHWVNDAFSLEEASHLLQEVTQWLSDDERCAVVESGDRMVVLSHPEIATRTICMECPLLHPDQFSLYCKLTDSRRVLPIEFLATDGPEKKVDLAHVQASLRKRFVPAGTTGWF